MSRNSFQHHFENESLKKKVSKYETNNATMSQTNQQQRMQIKILQQLLAKEKQKSHNTKYYVAIAIFVGYCFYMIFRANQNKRKVNS